MADTERRTRKPNGEGTIKQRGDSYWTQVKINGRRHSITGRTRKQVQQMRRELLAQADKGMLPASNRLTVAQYLQSWLEDTVKPNLRPSTYRDYYNTVYRYAIPAFGNLKLEKLQPAHLQSLYADMLRGGLKAKTVRNVHGGLHSAFEQAMKWNLIPRNVADAVEQPKAKQAEIRTLSRDQIKLMLEAAGNNRWGALLNVAVNTGMRQGELLGLRWKDVELESKPPVLRVRQQYDRSGSFSEPKTARGVRSIDIPPATVAVLREHRIRQVEERLIAGEDWQDNDLVFTTFKGGPLGHRNALRAFSDILKHAGIPHVEFHALRHTHATILLADGVPVLDVSERLGHSTPTVTMNVYGHVLPDAGRNIAARLERLFG